MFATGDCVYIYVYHEYWYIDRVRKKTQKQQQHTQQNWKTHT